MTLPDALDVQSRPRSDTADPLDWFLAEHQRHRQFCRLLNALAVAEAFDEAQVTAALDFFAHDVPQHFADEEETLFPALRAHALPEDEIAAVLDRLHAEHEADADRVRQLSQALQVCLARRQPPSTNEDVKQALQHLARSELHHLALENAVVLPIARLRLAAPDLAAMSERLAVRRRAGRPI